jgi:cell division transport system permease protein
MKKINFGYYLSEGFKSIFTHGFMSFVSACIIVACLLIMGSFSLLAVNVNSIIGEFESENVVLAYVDEQLSESGARALRDEIAAIPNVSSVSFISREEAMESFTVKQHNEARFENLDASILRHRFAVYVKDVALTAETTDTIRLIPGIAWVNANLVIAKGLVTVRNVVSGVSLILVAILLVISLFIMSNTIKLATVERREEIAIMRIVGATAAFIRWPFVFEGFTLGIFGSLVAYILQWLIYAGVTGRFYLSRTSNFIATIPFSRVSLPMFLIFVIIGFGVGVIGSSMAIRKYLKV